MLDVINVVAPVFAIVILGYVAVSANLYPKSGVAGLIAFVNNFATPFLLFRAALTFDFATFSPGEIAPFYIAAISIFIIGIIIARVIFSNRPGESVNSGFSATFSNTVLLGIPIIQRAFGDEAMPILFAIIGIHAAILLTMGMVTMELVRQDGAPLHKVLPKTLMALVKNPLLIGIVCGFAANLAGVTLPLIAEDFIRIMSQAIVPAALFGLGGALVSYKLRDNWQQASMMSALKLIGHPALVWLIMIGIMRVDIAIARYVILTAAMPSGINAYIFATYFNRGTDLAANTVLITTFMSIFTVSAWLILLT